MAISGLRTICGLRKRKKTGLLFVLTTALFACLLVPAERTLAQETGATAVINDFNAALLNAMKGSAELGYTGRYDLLEPMIIKSFDLYYMARKSAGKYWRDMDDGQQTLLLDTFTQWTIASYAGRFKKYSGEVFKIAGETASGKTVTVNSQMIKPGGDPVDFRFRLRERRDGWRIVDIQIKGVSQLALTRSQFTSLLGGKGFDALIAKLNTKTEFYRKKEAQ